MNVRTGLVHAEAPLAHRLTRLRRRNGRYGAKCARLEESQVGENLPVQIDAGPCQRFPHVPGVVAQLVACALYSRVPKIPGILFSDRSLHPDIGEGPRLTRTACTKQLRPRPKKCPVCR
jgi:hypothetical protein